MSAAIKIARRIIESANIEATVNIYPTTDALYSTWERRGFWVAITVRAEGDGIDVLVTMPEIATSAPGALAALSLSLEVAWVAARIEAETNACDAAVSGMRRLASAISSTVENAADRAA
jgi:hypothetical protein